MKKLILASASPQRRKLMKILGLPFIVSPSQAKEITRLTRGCAHLVQTNALLKALDVARGRDTGIVIGSDTVVMSSKGRLILKPQNLQEAKKNLKELMAQPALGLFREWLSLMQRQGKSKLIGKRPRYL